MTISGQKKISVYDPATATVVQFNNISSSAVYERTMTESEISSGKLLYSGEEATIEFECYDDAGFTQLETWMEDRADVNLVSYGLQNNILWYAPSKVTVKKNKSFAVNSLNGLIIKLTAKGPNLNIKIGQNILHLLNGWQDVNPVNNIADNYTITQYETFTFSNDQQRIQNALMSTASFVPTDIIYPISGAQFQLSINLISIMSDGTNTSINLFYRSFTDSLLASASQNLETNNFVTLQSVAQTWKIRCQVVRTQAVDASLDIKFKFPYLGVPLGSHKNITF